MKKKLAIVRRFQLYGESHTEIDVSSSNFLIFAVNLGEILHLKNILDDEKFKFLLGN